MKAGNWLFQGAIAALALGFAGVLIWGGLLFGLSLGREERHLAVAVE